MPHELSLPVRSADDLMVLWVTLREAPGSIQSPQLGRIEGARCKHCGDGRPTEVTNGNHEPGKLRRYLVCYSCRRRWDGVAVAVRVGPSSRRIREMSPARERLLTARAQVAPVFAGRPRALPAAEWRMLLDVLEWYLHPLVGTYAAVATLGLDRWPELEWSLAYARGRVAQARQHIDTRGRRRGVITGG